MGDLRWIKNELCQMMSDIIHLTFAVKDSNHFRLLQSVQRSILILEWTIVNHVGIINLDVSKIERWS